MNLRQLVRKSDTEWWLPRAGKMRVPGIIFATRDLLEGMDDKVAQQVANVAALPGIVTASFAMPDAHWGYGFPIGGVGRLRPGRRRRRVRGWRGLRHLVRRADPAHQPHARRGPAQARSAGRHAVSRRPLRGRQHQPPAPRPRRARRPHGARRALGGRARPRRGRGSRLHGGARHGGGRQSRRGFRRGQAPAARPTGHPRLGQPLPRGAGRGRDSRRRRSPPPTACALATWC